MCQYPVTYESFNVPGPCDLTSQAITPPRNCQDPRVIKSPQIPTQNPPVPHKYPQDIDTNPLRTYNRPVTPTENTYVSCVSSSTEAAL
jgi:hypothetical protein